MENLFSSYQHIHCQKNTIIVLFDSEHVIVSFG